MYPGCTTGGMPDLLLWHVGQRRAKASEVKGPRDRLSEQQRAWAAALAAGGLDVEVPIHSALHTLGWDTDVVDWDDSGLTLDARGPHWNQTILLLAFEGAGSS